MLASMAYLGSDGYYFYENELDRWWLVSPMLDVPIYFLIAVCAVCIIIIVAKAVRWCKKRGSQDSPPRPSSEEIAMTASIR